MTPAQIKAALEQRLAEIRARLPEHLQRQAAMQAHVVAASLFDHLRRERRWR